MVNTGWSSTDNIVCAGKSIGRSTQSDRRSIRIGWPVGDSEGGNVRVALRQSASGTDNWEIRVAIGDFGVELQGQRTQTRTGILNAPVGIGVVFGGRYGDRSTTRGTTRTGTASDNYRFVVVRKRGRAAGDIINEKGVVVVGTIQPDRALGKR
jgi:hypothetical protein